MNNDNNNIGNFICELRKSNNMTQKQLAEKLNVTDKAVSKWERGLSCPDIGTLLLLSETLGVTTNELLNGKKEENISKEKEQVNKNIFTYAEKLTEQSKASIISVIKIIIQCLFITSIVVCSIIDFALTKSFTWSLYPITSVIFVWIAVFPLLYFKKHQLIFSLCSFSIFLLPFLFILKKVLNLQTDWFMPLAFPVSLILVLLLWIIFFLYKFTKFNRWKLSSVIVLFIIPLELIINYIIENFVETEKIIDIWDILVFAIVIAVSAVFYALGQKNSKKHK